MSTPGPAADGHDETAARIASDWCRGPEEVGLRDDIAAALRAAADAARADQKRRDAEVFAPVVRIALVLAEQDECPACGAFWNHGRHYERRGCDFEAVMDAALDAIERGDGRPEGA